MDAGTLTIFCNDANGVHVYTHLVLLSLFMDVHVEEGFVGIVPINN